MGKETMTVPRISSILVCLVVLASSAVVIAPAGAKAAGGQESRNNISITSDADFDADHGVRSGSGTAADPYVISGWDISRITLSDTSSYVVIRDNDIASQLVLNWNGDRVTLVRNHIGDLRVNQNVERTGLPTSGRIANNEFGVVGQLRHFDGVFENNVVGDPEAMSVPFFNDRAVNFDGFNGARFRNNTIYGFMDVKLHGHHHGSGFGMGSHDHSSMDPHHQMDHSQRFHEVWVTGNTIYADYDYALGFNDRNHSANDRTANSEENPELNKPHVHHTRVHMNGNHLVGAGLLVDIFNAQDELHETFAMGRLDIDRNLIELDRGPDDVFQARNGIWIRSLRYANVHIGANRIKGVAETDLLDEQADNDAGIYLDQVEHSKVRIVGDSVSDMGFGVEARALDQSVRWWIVGLETDGVSQREAHDSGSPAPKERS